MTLHEFTNFKNLQDRLARNKELLESLCAAVEFGSQVIDGMPHAPGAKDRIGNLVVEIEDLKARNLYLEEEIKMNRQLVIDYIDGIEDEYVQLIFRLRFLRCLQWKEVAALTGGGNTVDGVKSACYRYLNKGY